MHKTRTRFGKLVSFLLFSAALCRFTSLGAPKHVRDSGRTRSLVSGGREGTQRCLPGLLPRALVTLVLGTCVLVGGGGVCTRGTMSSSVLTCTILRLCRWSKNGSAFLWKYLFLFFAFSSNALFTYVSHLLYNIRAVGAATVTTVLTVALFLRQSNYYSCS